MKVIANLSLCQGHARCQDICPDVFATDERLGKVIVRVAEVARPLEELAALAVSNCPEGALTIGDSGEG